MSDFSEPVEQDEEISKERVLHHLKCIGSEYGWLADEVIDYISQLQRQISDEQKLRNQSDENWRQVMKGLSIFVQKKYAERIVCLENAIERAFDAKEWGLCLDELEKVRKAQKDGQ
jgi:hypothetical protein